MCMINIIAKIQNTHNKYRKFGSTRFINFPIQNDYLRQIFGNQLEYVFGILKTIENFKFSGKSRKNFRI